ncbi:hypothetical protein BBP40_007109 [Aspergillus hancockii]|nr:hypothetical protein BBP40_007109 [Aspergillus hancockii]
MTRVMLDFLNSSATLANIIVVLQNLNPPVKANPHYELYATIFHDGEDRKQGHYTVTLKWPSGQWVLIDDDKEPEKIGRTVSEMMQFKNHGQNAYILAYRRLPLSGDDAPWKKEFPEIGYKTASHCVSAVGLESAPEPPSSGSTDPEDEPFILSSPLSVSPRLESPQPAHCPLHQSVPEPSASHIKTGEILEPQLAPSSPILCLLEPSETHGESELDRDRGIRE